jgi:hypothetical protein
VPDQYLYKLCLGTLLAAFCFLVCVLLCYLGYRQFCHPGKKHKGTAPPPTCATCSTCPSWTSLCPAWEKEAMEDRYYASMQRHQCMRYEDNDFGFAFPPHRYQQPRQPGFNRDILWITLIMSLWPPSYVNFCKRLLYRWPKSIKLRHLRLQHSRSISATTWLPHDPYNASAIPILRLLDKILSCYPIVGVALT